MKPYNHVVDAGCPSTMPVETHLIRLLSVELRMPVLVTKTCARTLAAKELVNIVGPLTPGKTIKGLEEECARVEFTPEGRRLAMAHWTERKAAAYCTWVHENPDGTLAARRARLLQEAGLVSCACVNPTTSKGSEMPEPKKRYSLKLTPKGRALVEGN